MDTASLSRLTTTALRVSSWIETASAGKVTPIRISADQYDGPSMHLHGDADAFVAAIGVIVNHEASDSLGWVASDGSGSDGWYCVHCEISIEGVRVRYSAGSMTAPAWLLARCPRPAEQVAA